MDTTTTPGPTLALAPTPAPPPAAARPVKRAFVATGPRRFASRWIGLRFRGWLGGTAAVLLGLLLLAPLASRHESALEAADARAFPPPGRMVDVGGHRLHLHCAGSGGPTVVIDAGMGGWSASWGSWVQPEAARVTRVCTYDRAGMGHSDAGPLPRTARRMAAELHTLLREGGEAGPYVLVGHSLGGLVVRVFAHEYASEVAGVVLIESTSPPSAAPSPSASVAPGVPGTPGAPTTPKQSGLLSAGRWALALPARVGLLRLLAGPLGLADGLSPELAATYTAISVTPRPMLTTQDEFFGTAESAAQAGMVTSLGSTPLLVLSRGVPEAGERQWQHDQTELLRLSSDSHQLFAERSGHNVQFDQPAAAVGAIAQMVEQVRGRAAQ